MNASVKLVVLSSAESTHTIRWANSIAKRGIQVLLLSQHKLLHDLDPDVVFCELRYKGGKGYFLNTLRAKKIIKKFNPDYIHAHYASGYGTLAKNLGMPYFLSVWGSDVYDFPSNLFKRYLLKRSLEGASKLFSTSECMKIRTQQFTSKNINVIPFGVDVDKFSPSKKVVNNKFTIGIVKVIDHKYGIDTLLQAFSILVQRLDVKLELVIVGDGPQMLKMQELAEKLGINKYTNFLGWIPNSELPSIINSLNLFVVPSRMDSESFGVAAVEAGSCELPCVVSDVGGLPEVIINNETGLVVKKENPDELANKIEYLINNPSILESMGKKARLNVVKNYNWKCNVSEMLTHYGEGI